jgi:hypothetical protein
MASTAAKYPNSAADVAGSGGSVWSSVNQALTNDGLSASVTLGIADPKGGDFVSDSLFLSGFSLNVPASSQIAGIFVEVSGVGYAAIQVQKPGGGGSTTYVRTLASPVTFGGPTDLIGGTWTPADINAANFGISVRGDNPSSQNSASASVDWVRLTVYYTPTTAAADVPARYDYKVYNQGFFLGTLPNVTSEFAYPHEINTAGSQITIEVAASADSANIPSTTGILDEAGVAITDETNDPLLTEGAINITGLGTTSGPLIKNGNQIVVIETNYYYPNGRVAFVGEIERWEANFGGDATSESIKVLVYSNGQDMDNYLVYGSPYVYTLDQQATGSNTADNLYTNNNGYNRDGQTFTVGTGVTSVAAIAVKLNGAGTVTLSLYASVAAQQPLAAVTLNVNTGGGPADVQFNFSNRLIVTPGSQLFFAVVPQTGSSISIYYQNTDLYTGGTMYNANYAGGSGGGSWAANTTADLYFKTYSGTGTTAATFTNQDPTTGMVKASIDDYRGRGGQVNYGIGTIQATNLSLTYTVTTNTLYELLKAALSLAPNGFYYYVDVATSTLYFKQSNTVADIILVKGKHINKVTVVATIENMKNLVYFTGGIPSGQTTNLYKAYQSGSSIANYGPRLERKSDNRVTLSSTADAIGNSEIAELKDEQYQTLVSVPALTMDISLFKPGMVVGFRGFGTFVDNELSQIVRIDYTPGKVDLTLGIIPKRLTPEFERITRGLIAQQTIANPSTPS